MKRNNIINNWLEDNGKPLPENWFKNTHGCVLEINEGGQEGGQDRVHCH
jgi:hypothetical protein